MEIDEHLCSHFELYSFLTSLSIVTCRLVAETGGQFGNTEEGEHLPLEAAPKQRQ
jgi:hypothetical protein